MVGRYSGPRHAASIAARPGLALDRGDERLAHLVLAHLRLEPDELLQERGHARALAAGVQHPRHARLPGDVLTPELVHDRVAVALEQRHERLHAGERAPLLVAGEEGDEPAVVERVAPVAELVGGAARAPARARRGSGSIDDSALSTSDR